MGEIEELNNENLPSGGGGGGVPLKLLPVPRTAEFAVLL